MRAALTLYVLYEFSLFSHCIFPLNEILFQWEQRVDENRQVMTSPSFGEPVANIRSQSSFHSNAYNAAGTIGSSYFPSEHRTTVTSSGNPANSGYYGPAATEVGRNLNVIEQEIRDYKIREQEMFTQPTFFPQMTSSPGISSAQIEKEKDLLPIYLNTRPEIVNELGIILPHPIKQKFRNLGPAIPMVELQEIKGSRARNLQSPIVMNGNAAAMNGFGYGSGSSTMPNSRFGTLDRSGPAGRYVKHTQPSSRKIARRPSIENVDRGMRQQDVKSPAFEDGGTYLSPGESLIAREIRELKDKEDDLRRSRSELGLPTLEDTLEIWKQSRGQYRTQIPLRGAQSYDHLQHAVDSEGAYTLPRSNRAMSAAGAGGMSLPFKAGSLDHIHQSHLSNQEDPNKGFDTVGNVTTLTAPPRNKGAKAAGFGNGRKSPYEMYLAAHHPSKVQPVDSFPPPTNHGGTGRRATEYIPVESRIEAEVADLQQREAEIRLVWAFGLAVRFAERQKRGTVPGFEN